MKSEIVLVISPTLVLIPNQIYAYSYLLEEKLTLNKLKRLVWLNIPAMALIADYTQNNRQVWSCLEAEAYSIVLGLPEVFLVHDSVFLLRIVQNRL